MQMTSPEACLNLSIPITHALLSSLVLTGLRLLAISAVLNFTLGAATPNLESNIARPLRYFPINGDFVITNGAEFFNRPLYCLNSALRIDGGDKPEFSLYLPGRGGNLRLGIKTSAGIKWLNDAQQIISRYRAGEMIYEISDPLLQNGKLILTVLPLSETKGLILRAEFKSSGTGVSPVRCANTTRQAGRLSH